MLQGCQGTFSQVLELERLHFFNKIQDWILKFERIRKRNLRLFTKQINPRSLSSFCLWCVKGTEESQSGFFFSDSVRFRILSDLRIQSWIFKRKTHLVLTRERLIHWERLRRWENKGHHKGQWNLFAYSIAQWETSQHNNWLFPCTSYKMPVYKPFTLLGDSLSHLLVCFRLRHYTAAPHLIQGFVDVVERL